MTAELRRSKDSQIRPGFALDLTVIDPDDGRPWDFNKRAKRDKALKMLRTEKPLLLVAGTECCQKY